MHRQRLIAQQQAREDPPPEDNDHIEEKGLSYDDAIQDHGKEGIKSMTGFTFEEFEFLFSIVASSLKKDRRGKRPKYNPKDMFFITVVYLTTGMKMKELAILFKIRVPRLQRTLYYTIPSIELPLMERFMTHRA